MSGRQHSYRAQEIEIVWVESKIKTNKKIIFQIYESGSKKVTFHYSVTCRVTAFQVTTFWQKFPNTHLLLSHFFTWWLQNIYQEQQMKPDNIAGLASESTTSSGFVTSVHYCASFPLLVGVVLNRPAEQKLKDSWPFLPTAFVESRQSSVGSWSGDTQETASQAVMWIYFLGVVC